MATPLLVPLTRSSNFDCSQVRVPSPNAALARRAKDARRWIERIRRRIAKLVPQLHKFLGGKIQGIMAVGATVLALSVHRLGIARTRNPTLPFGEPFLIMTASSFSPNVARGETYQPRLSPADSKAN